MDPGPLPLGVAVIDSSVRLYGMLFPRVSDKHKQQMLQHFKECMKQAKAARQQAIQINIFTAVLCALRVCYLIYLYCVKAILLMYICTMMRGYATYIYLYCVKVILTMYIYTMLRGYAT